VGFHSGYGVPGNDSYTKILLHMDGANGGTTFADIAAGAANSHIWTPTNGVTATGNPKFGSAALQCSAGYVRSVNDSDFTLGSADWTIDFWVNNNGITGSQSLCGQLNYAGGINSGPLYSVKDSSGRVFFGVSNGSAFTVVGGAGSPPTIQDSQWHHVAFVRGGGTLRLFLDGSQIASDGFSGLVQASSGAPFGVGINGDYAGASLASMLFDEFRLSIGIARWTSNFTPPDAPYI
jgi:hypothetical protein